MARYILDTNTLTELEYPDTPDYQIIMSKIASLPAESEICFSIISAYEYQHGIAKASGSLKESIKKAWQTFLDLFEALPLTLESAKIYGEIKALYESHTGIGKKEIKRHTVDFILASSAIELDAVVVSADRIFQTIQKLYPSLRFENWKEA
jgi:predicted nucleic acid-binding protein